MLKANTLIGALALLLLFMYSCKEDDPGTTDPPADTVTLDCSDINTLTTLEDLGSGVDYIVPCFIEVTAGLVIEPGVTIEFQQDAGFEIQDYGSSEGYFVAEGTEDDPITFTGVVKQPGAWEQIRFESEDLRNKMAHTIVEYGGGQDGDSPAIDVDDEARVELTNSTVRNNKGYGLLVDNGGSIEGFANNTFTDNESYPLHIAANNVQYLDGTNSDYTGNTTDGIYVFSNSIYDRGFLEGQDAHVWENPGVTIYVNELIKIGEREFGHLRIEEGCVLSFGEEFGIEVEEHSAVLEIVGTQANPVTLEGRNGAGSWDGIYLNTNATQNKIENAVITDGGQNAWSGYFDGNPANISLGYPGDDVSLVLTNVELNNSGGWRYRQPHGNQCYLFRQCQRGFLRQQLNHPKTEHVF